MRTNVDTAINFRSFLNQNILEITKVIHDNGGLVYADGANLNALLGVTKFGDLGIDICHSNLHKTFSTPHGGGGPGSGPVMVAKYLESFLPYPHIKKKAMITNNINLKIQSEGLMVFMGLLGYW